MTDERRKNSANSGRDAKGRFAPGNPGRAKGQRGRAAQAAQAMLDGECEAITRTAIDAALSGDTVALRLVLERILPVRKDSPVQFTLPAMETATDAARAAGAVLAATGAGELSPAEACHVMQLVETYRKTLETSELETRIAALEGNE